MNKLEELNKLFISGQKLKAKELNDMVDTINQVVTHINNNESLWSENETFTQELSDWSQTDNTKINYIKNKPNLAAVATSGSYNDLNNKPTISSVQYTQKVFLPENGGVLTQAMVNTANTVYVIQHDYTISNNIAIPGGCTLEFAGGSLNGGKLSGTVEIINKPADLYEKVSCLELYVTNETHLCVADISEVFDRYDKDELISQDAIANRYSLAHFYCIAGMDKIIFRCPAYAFDNSSGTSYPALPYMRYGFYDRDFQFIDVRPEWTGRDYLYSFTNIPEGAVYINVWFSTDDQLNKPMILQDVLKYMYFNFLDNTKVYVNLELKNDADVIDFTAYGRWGSSEIYYNSYSDASLSDTYHIGKYSKGNLSTGSYFIPRSILKNYDFIQLVGHGAGATYTFIDGDTSEERNYNSMIIAFLKKTPLENGEVIEYCDTYPWRIDLSQQQSPILAIPDDCKCIFVYKAYAWQGTINDCSPKQILLKKKSACDIGGFDTTDLSKISNRDVNTQEIKFVHWNIGADNIGGLMPRQEQVTSELLTKRRDSFNAFFSKINRTHNLLLNELNYWFDAAHSIDYITLSASSVWQGKKRFDMRQYQNLGIFYKNDLLEYKYGTFECLKGFTEMGTASVRGGRYYSYGYTIYHYPVAGANLYVMHTHLPTPISADSMKKLYREMKSILAYYPNIVIVGDFNDAGTYNPYTHSGNNFANLEEVFTEEEGWHIANKELDDTPTLDFGKDFWNPTQPAAGRTNLILDFCLWKGSYITMSDFSVRRDAIIVGSEDLESTENVFINDSGSAEGNEALLNHRLSDHWPLEFTIKPATPYSIVPDTEGSTRYNPVNKKFQWHNGQEWEDAGGEGGGGEQVQSDWNVTDTNSPAYIKNKPSQTGQVQSDWNQTNTSEPDYIKNKPNLAIVATSGSYNDLTDKPSEQYSQKVFLEENGGVLTQAMVNTANTIYVIQYDYTLSANITIPAGCLLEFAGGTIGGSGKTLTGNNTAIVAAKTQIFNSNLTLAGTWNVKESYVEWFGVIPNDSTIDATSAIKKLVAVGMPVQFFDGTYYLSECLINGIKGVSLKGTGTHYKDGTIFKAFNATGQRFILKLGGEANFVPNIPERESGETDQHYSDRKNAYYKSIWCSNFILDGIKFQTYSTTFTNADTTGVSQNYAACCFDWCVEGYVNIKHEGMRPGVFVANTWEVYFESIVLYGSYTGLDESALYFGKAYTDLVASNISAVTINNLFGESISGKFVDCHNNCNIADLIINNVEFEPVNGTSNYSSIRAAAFDIIESNIRSMDVLYYFNFAGVQIVIHSLMYCGYALTYNNDTVARGLLCAKTYGCYVTIGKVINDDTDNVIDIFGAVGYAKISIGSVQFSSYGGAHTVNNSTIFKGHTAIYTLPATTDVSNITDGLSGNNSGIIEIKDAWAVIDQDLVNTYNPGILFDSESFGKVYSLCMSNYTSAQITANINGGFVSLLYFRGVTLDRKFRFNGTKLIFYYTAPNRWDTENIIITYYKWNNNAYEVVQTDNIKLNISYTEILKHEYTIYTGDYDYCTIRFKSAVCIESVYLE